MIRNIVYNAIRTVVERLADANDGRMVWSVDMFSRSEEWLDQVSRMTRPLVLVEIGQQQWQRTKEPGVYMCDGQVSLHVVTDWNGEADNARAFAVADAVAAVDGMEGEGFGRVALQSSVTDRVGDVMECVETFSIRLIRQAASRGTERGYAR
nr:MAG TPA: hypothetical protein [Caudoviricetes sp.]